MEEKNVVYLQDLTRLSFSQWLVLVKRSKETTNKIILFVLSIIVMLYKLFHIPFWNQFLNGRHLNFVPFQADKLGVETYDELVTLTEAFEASGFQVVGDYKIPEYITSPFVRGMVNPDLPAYANITIVKNVAPVITITTHFEDGTFLTVINDFMLTYPPFIDLHYYQLPVTELVEKFKEHLAKAKAESCQPKEHSKEKYFGDYLNLHYLTIDYGVDHDNLQEKVSHPSDKLLTCINHSSIFAFGQCSSCGVPLCSSCAVEFPEGIKCSKCAQDTPSAEILLDKEKAGFGIRLLALLIDKLLVTAVGLIIGALLIVLSINVFKLPAPVNLSLPIVSAYLVILFGGAFYSIYLNGKYGMTLGKMLLGLRVVNYNGESIGYWQAFVRWTGYWVSAFLFGYGFLMVGWDKNKQGLSDKLASTVVLGKNLSTLHTILLVIGFLVIVFLVFSMFLVYLYSKLLK